MKLRLIDALTEQTAKLIEVGIEDTIFVLIKATIQAFVLQIDRL